MTDQAHNTNAGPSLPNRACNGCTLCCKLLEIPTIEKPRGVSCPNCEIGVGCKIYTTRPPECAAFKCGYLLNSQFNYEWQPERSHIVMDYKPGSKQIIAYVDTSRPGAWKREPYYSTLKRMASSALSNGGQVNVMLGRKLIIILPDRDEDLGEVADDQIITLAQDKSGRWTANRGPRLSDARPSSTFD